MAIRMVCIDDTRHWRADIVAKVGGKLLSVYVYDDESRTFCCESTPSRFLRYVGTDLPELPEMSDENREELEDDIRIAGRQYDPDTYMHCSSADALEHKIIPVERDEDDGDDLQGDLKYLDRAVEQLNANCGAYDVCPI